MRKEPVFTPREQSIRSSASVLWAWELRTCAVPLLRNNPPGSPPPVGRRLLLAALLPVHAPARRCGEVPGAQQSELLQSTHHHPTLHLYFYYLSLYIHLLSIPMRMEAQEGRHTSQHLHDLSYGRCSMKLVQRTNGVTGSEQGDWLPSDIPSLE